MYLSKGIKNLLFIVTLLLSYYSKGQQFTQYSSYLINSHNINAGYTGSRDLTTVMLAYRYQWHAIPGAPRTTNINAHGMIMGTNIGVGGGLLYDKIGPLNFTYLSASGAYRLKITQNVKLQFGVSAGAVFINTDYSDIQTIVEDPQFSDDYREVQPIIGTGLFLFHQKYYFGLSTPNIYRDQSSEFETKQHYYISGGYIFTLTDVINLKEAVLIKAVSGKNSQIDISSTLIFRESVALGFSIRPRISTVMLLQFYKIKDRIDFAYAFDIMNNNLNNYNSSTHEITILTTLGKEKKTIVSPRYF